MGIDITKRANNAQNKTIVVGIRRCPSSYWNSLSNKEKYFLMEDLADLPRDMVLRYEAETEKALVTWVNPKKPMPKPIKIGRFEITEVSGLDTPYDGRIILSLVESPDIELFRELKTSSTYSEVEEMFYRTIRGVIFIHNEMEQSVSLRAQSTRGEYDVSDVDFREIKIHYGLMGEPALQLPVKSYDDVRFFLAHNELRYSLIFGCR